MENMGRREGEAGNRGEMRKKQEAEEMRWGRS